MSDIQLTPFRELTTPRLQLRRLSAADAPEVLFLRSDEAVLRYIFRKKEQTVAQAEAHLQLLEELLAQNKGINWGLSRPQEPALLGSICLWNVQPENRRAEVGYVLHPAHWGQGLMSEALAAVLRFGFAELKLHAIEAHVNPGNEASCRLLEKHGFVREGYLRENICFEGRYYDTVLYSLLAREAAL